MSVTMGSAPEVIVVRLRINREVVHSQNAVGVETASMLYGFSIIDDIHILSPYFHELCVLCSTFQDGTMVPSSFVL